MRRIRVIATAYACEPDTGSETGIGWNIVREVSRQSDIHLTVITRVNNREAINRALEADPAESLEFVYCDLPRWASFWKRGRRGLQLYYYLWQAAAGRVARRLHRRQAFDCSHHITFGRYWSPSFLPMLPIPFVWGPLGGGESYPDAFRSGFDRRAAAYEWLRGFARNLGERDPIVKRAARKCALAFAATTDTAARLAVLGVQRVDLLGNAALSRQETDVLGRLGEPPASPIRFVSVGRLLHWKGVDIGLRAFAASGVLEGEYWILGDGPARGALEDLARDLQIEDRVRFWGNVSRDQVMECLSLSHTLVHPSLHDSGGWACIEAMAAGRPVICLDLGGPAIMVDDDSGYKIRAADPDAAIEGVAAAMRDLSEREGRLAELGAAAAARVNNGFRWEKKANEIADGYRRVLGLPRKSSIIDTGQQLASTPI